MFLVLTNRVTLFYGRIKYVANRRKCVFGLRIWNLPQHKTGGPNDNYNNADDDDNNNNNNVKNNNNSKKLFIPNLVERSRWKLYKGEKTTPIKC